VASLLAADGVAGDQVRDPGPDLGDAVDGAGDARETRAMSVMYTMRNREVIWKATLLATSPIA